jgi:hypothetical protein
VRGKEGTALQTGEADGGFLNKPRFQNLWLTVGFLLVMLVMGASLMPNPSHALYFEGRDKLGHFAAYMAITFWFTQIYTRNRVRWTIALGLVVLGISLEYLQRLSGLHAFEYADMGANTAGVL